MKGKALRRLLERAPLSYRGPSTGSGSSHTKLVSTSGYPDLLFSFHDNADIAPGLVRKILVKDVGLTEDEALRLAGGGWGTMREIIVRYHYEAEGWWAESEDVPGWSAAGGSFSEVRELAKEGLATFLGGDIIIADDITEVSHLLVNVHSSPRVQPQSETQTGRVKINAASAIWNTAFYSRQQTAGMTVQYERNPPLV